MKIIIILLALYLCGCNNFDNKPVQIIDARFSIENTLKLSDFVQSIELIPLQTTNKSLIGKIVKIICHNNKYYISSATSSLVDRILVYGKNGEFLYLLDKIGRGPDEYLEIADFDVLNDSTVIMISTNDPRLFIYDIKRGVCLINKKLEVFPRNILLIEGYIYLFNKGLKLSKSSQGFEQSKYVIAKYNLKGEIIDSYCEPDVVMHNKISYISSIKPFSLNESKIYFNYPLSNTIYEINNNQLFPAFSLDFGNKKLPENIFNKKTTTILEIMDEVKTNKGVFMVPYVNIASNFIHFTIQDFENNGYVAFYDRVKKQTLIGHNIIDNMYFKGNKYSLKRRHLPQNMDGDTILWQVDPLDLKTAYNDFKKKSTKDNYESFCNNFKNIVTVCENVKDDDNPVIIKMTITLR